MIQMQRNLKKQDISRDDIDDINGSAEHKNNGTDNYDSSSHHNDTSGTENGIIPYAENDANDDEYTNDQNINTTRPTEDTTIMPCNMMVTQIPEIDKPKEIKKRMMEENMIVVTPMDQKTTAKTKKRTTPMDKKKTEKVLPPMD